MQWLRRSFMAGFFVTVPLVVSVAAFVWIFNVLDGLLRPVFAKWLGQDVPGLGILATAARRARWSGAVATNVVGKRVLGRAERDPHEGAGVQDHLRAGEAVRGGVLARQRVGFKRVVLVEDPRRGFVLGFLTKEFTLDRGHGAEPLLAVYVPTNHLYLGDVLVFARDAVSFPDLTVEEGIRVFLTGRDGDVVVGRRQACRPGSDLILTVVFDGLYDSGALVQAMPGGCATGFP